MNLQHLTSMKNLSVEQMMHIIEQASSFKRNGIPQLSQQYVMSNLFFENSTRTKLSFEMAEKRLGIETIPFDADHSSTQKGETLYDTVKTLEAIGFDALVIRHPEDHYYEELVEKIKIPIINGGDGSGQHPSQSLLDLFTIYEEFGRFEHLHITIAGDIAHSRVAKSNADALSRLGANVQFVCPSEWSGNFESSSQLDDFIETTDVMMLLRVQHERHSTSQSFSKEAYHQQFGLTLERVKRLKKEAIIMHPAPVNRGVEIADELVEHEQSRIFTQVSNGVFVRAAILHTILGRNGK